MNKERRTYEETIFRIRHHVFIVCNQLCLRLSNGSKNLTQT